MTIDEKLEELKIANRRNTSIENTSALVDEAVTPLKKGLRLNGILTGGGILGVGGFLTYCLALMLSVQTAQAQAKAQTDKNAEEIKELKASDAETKSRLATLERTAIRSEVMTEQIVIKLGMAPPPKLTADGGHP